MDNQKDNHYFIKKIIADLSFVLEHTRGLTQIEFERNELLIDSTLFRLIQVSENSDKLTESFKSFHDEIPWRAMKGMRNRIVHEYGRVDLTVIYQTVIKDIPPLLDKLNHMME